MLKKIIFSLFILITGSCFADAKVQTPYDFILWTGSGMPDDFDIKHLTISQREDALELGLFLCESFAEEDDSLFQWALSTYYLTSKKNKNTKKGTYWAFRGAENGEEMCMSNLRSLYLRGEGVVKDYSEGFKWLILAAAAGSEPDLEILSKYGHSLETDSFYSSFYKSGRNKALLWQESHKDLFVSK